MFAWVAGRAAVVVAAGVPLAAGASFIAAVLSATGIAMSRGVLSVLAASPVPPPHAARVVRASKLSVRFMISSWVTCPGNPAR